MSDYVDARLQRVSDLFDQIVEHDAPAGVQFAVRQRGELLFSRVAGTAKDDGSPLRHDSLLPVFSGTKGLVAGVVAVLADRGLVRYDDLLSKYWEPAHRWPELTVAHCMSHRAGMPQLDGLTIEDDLYDLDAMIELLAHNTPIVPIGTRMAYHYMTYGWFAHVIIKGATGMTAGQALRHYITEPYDIDAYLGLPESELSRCADVMKASDYRTNVFLKPDNQFAETVYGVSPLTRPSMSWNDPRNLVRESPGGGVRSNADAMSKFYDTMLNTDAPNALLTPAGLAAAWTPRFEDIDFATDRPIVMAMGFERDDSIRSYGDVAPAFGHTGAGGSIHGCWPEHGISFSFTPRTMRTDQADQRGKSLLVEVQKALIS